MSSLVRKRSDAIQDKATFMYFMDECQKISFNLEMALLHEFSFQSFSHGTIYVTRYM